MNKFILAAFLTIACSSCGTVARMNDLVNQSTCAIHENREAVERDTAEIYRNSRITEASTRAIVENHRLVEKMSKE